MMCDIGTQGGGITFVRYGLGRKKSSQSIYVNKCGVVVVFACYEGCPVRGIIFMT